MNLPQNYRPITNPKKLERLSLLHYLWSEKQITKNDIASEFKVDGTLIDKWFEQVVSMQFLGSLTINKFSQRKDVELIKEGVSEQLKLYCSGLFDELKNRKQVNSNHYLNIQKEISRVHNYLFANQ